MRFIVILGLSVILFSCKKQEYELIIRDATVYDGSGSDGVKTDVAINADTIAQIGNLSQALGKTEIDANGLTLAPGFIDTHSHHGRGLTENPLADAVVSQGVTTIIVGQDGGSHFPLQKYFQSLEEKAVAVNVGSYSGHNTLRDRILRNNYKRKSTQAEIDSMKLLLEADMRAGALGLSTGLEYDPGIYSSKEEVLQLASVLPQYNGRYISHLRSEDRYFWDALQEIITIGRTVKVPVQISHFKLAMRGLWGKADSALLLLDRARNEGIEITADLYPYTYWSSTIRVLFPDRNFNDKKEAAFILKEVTSAEGIIFSNYQPNPEYNGKSLAEAAKMEKRTNEDMLIELIRRLDECDKKGEECDGSIVATSMEENDVKKLMQWTHTNICSDGASTGRHPRGFGTFARILSRYVREEKTLKMQDAIFKMTGLAADQIGIKKRGRIKAGNYADLVLFDAEKVKDNATIENPQALSTGILHVWVNGKEVWSQGKTTGTRSGKVIYRNLK
ncbi:MAG: D-aminoacylase [Bacteroidetes bacterium]|nr:D-aminoacylase [Bacteroidota bacterium]MBS1541112.1 D-aminoacylase [Bacteroidota bacterium]